MVNIDLSGQISYNMRSDSIDMEAAMGIVKAEILKDVAAKTTMNLTQSDFDWKA